MRTTLKWGTQDHKSWTFVAPIGNLSLGRVVDRELKVNRVVFVHRDKLPYIRRRLGFYSRISELDAGRDERSFFRRAQAYAVVRHKGKPETVEKICLKLIREELAIINLSYLGYSKRNQGSLPALWGEHELRSLQYFLVNPDDSSRSAVAATNVNPNGLYLDGRWARSPASKTFLRLVHILNGTTKVHPEWRKDLQRASILVGEGMKPGDRASSFLKNMIALETLLTQRGDKGLSNTLPVRARAFLGWVGYWTTDGYEERIAEMYRKRNRLVHTGNEEPIRPEDLLFTDDLLFDLITNLVSFPERFGSKQKILAFAAKLAQDHDSYLAGRKDPIGLRFIHRMYQQKDLDRI